MLDLQVIEAQRPAFIALHMQEVGGKNYTQCMKQVPDFIGKLQQRLAVFGYCCGHSYVDEAFKRSDSFTVFLFNYFSSPHPN